MKRNLLYTFILLFVANLAISQISIDPQSIEFRGDGQDQITQYVDITNNTGSTLNFYWKYVPDEGYPSDWNTQICDINLCYAPNVLQCSPQGGNEVLDSKTIQFSIKVWNSNGVVEGNSFGILYLYDDADFTNVIATSSAPATSTTEINLDDLVIYPNPTTESFQLKNDDGIASVSIFNIVGRVVKTFTHTSGMIHDVTALRSGMYLVRLENRAGDVIKSMRLSKK
jgi:hypothetical protein